ncbi:hypothetical protein JXL19_09145 [bacterium]|nr:hypothetical protein [bacterium]
MNKYFTRTVSKFFIIVALSFVLTGVTVNHTFCQDHFSRAFPPNHFFADLCYPGTCPLSIYLFNNNPFSNFKIEPAFINNPNFIYNRFSSLINCYCYNLPLFFEYLYANIVSNPACISCFNFAISPFSYYGYGIKYLPGAQISQKVLVGISIDPNTINFSDINQTIQLAVTGTYSDGSTSDLTSSTTGTTYISSNPLVATVNSDGQVSSIGIGSASITANNKGTSNSSGVTVSIPSGTLGITILTPNDQHRFCLNKTSIELMGMLTGNPESVTVNGYPAAIDDNYGNTFSITLDISPGNNAIIASAIRGTQSVQDSITVYLDLDTEPPVISNVTPAGPVSLNMITVEGYVSHSSSDPVVDDEISVFVQGIIQKVDDATGHFSAHSILIDTNSNITEPETIIITAEDAQGNSVTATTSVYFNGDTNNPGETNLTANPAFGPAPLQVTFDVSITGLSATHGNIDFGDGNSTVITEGLSITHTYMEEKIFYPTLTIVEGNIKYSDSEIIEIDVSSANADNMIQTVWNTMKTSLLDSSVPMNVRIENALDNFSGLGEIRFRPLFFLLMNDLVDEINSMSAITPISIGNDLAVYSVTRDLFGETISFEIVFMRNGYGNWKIHNF